MQKEGRERGGTVSKSRIKYIGYFLTSRRLFHHQGFEEKRFSDQVTGYLCITLPPGFYKQCIPNIVPGPL